VAEREVMCFSDTSTIWAFPVASRWVSRFMVW
jgi:hypothetical protein